MPCYYPLTGWRAKRPNPETGKRSIVFDRNSGFADMEVTVPCGRCIGCRLEYSRQWAIRCTHEASLWDRNCFITLTYDNESLPENGSLVLDDFQRFMKRLRKRFTGFQTTTNKHGEIIKPIRFYHCGEYGDLYGRPHYHAVLFNFDFKDKELFTVRNGNQCYRSEILADLWPYGLHEIGNVTFESAAYVARYVMKKSKGEGSEWDYANWCPDTGMLLDFKKPEYCTMSRNPGIASDWFQQYKSDVFPKDGISINGKLVKPPKFYLGQYELEQPDEARKIKNSRKKVAKTLESDNSSDRLAVKEKVKKAQLKNLKRGLVQ